jgi:beta-carotene hydroxylase
MTVLPTIDELGRDLLVTSPARRRLVLARPLAGVAVFAAGWATGILWLLPAGVFVAFLSVIATTHDLVHGSLGLRRNARDLALAALPALVLQSGHVYRTTHPQHHRAFPHGEDPEGLTADASLVRTLLEGPVFLPRLWLWAHRRTASHPRQRRLLLAEAAVPPVAFGAGIALLPWTAAVLTWTVLTTLAGWLLPLLTVHLPHRRHGDTPETVARSLRWPLVPRLLLGLTHHLEHHLYPQVPSHHMAELARRLQPTLYASAAARCSAALRTASTFSPSRSSSQMRFVASRTTIGSTQTTTR